MVQVERFGDIAEDVQRAHVPNLLLKVGHDQLVRDAAEGRAGVNRYFVLGLCNSRLENHQYIFHAWEIKARWRRRLVGFDGGFVIEIPGLDHNLRIVRTEARMEM